MYRTGETMTGSRAPVASTSKLATSFWPQRCFSDRACLEMLASKEVKEHRYAQWDNHKVFEQALLSTPSARRDAQAGRDMIYLHDI